MAQLMLGLKYVKAFKSVKCNHYCTLNTCLYLAEMCIANYIPSYGPSLLCNVLCTLHSVLCTLYSVLCTPYCVLCTVYCVLCTVYSILCTVYISPTAKQTCGVCGKSAVPALGGGGQGRMDHSQTLLRLPRPPHHPTHCGESCDCHVYACT